MSNDPCVEIVHWEMSLHFLTSRLTDCTILLPPFSVNYISSTIYRLAY